MSLSNRVACLELLKVVQILQDKKDEIREISHRENWNKDEIATALFDLTKKVEAVCMAYEVLSGEKAPISHKIRKPIRAQLEEA